MRRLLVTIPMGLMLLLGCGQATYDERLERRISELKNSAPATDDATTDATSDDGGDDGGDEAEAAEGSTPEENDSDGSAAES